MATGISLSYGLATQGFLILVLVITRILSTVINVLMQITSAIYAYIGIITTVIITCFSLCFFIFLSNFIFCELFPNIGSYIIRLILSQIWSYLILTLRFIWLLTSWKIASSVFSHAWHLQENQKKKKKVRIWCGSILERISLHTLIKLSSYFDPQPISHWDKVEIMNKSIVSEPKNSQQIAKLNN